jgi:ribonucleoside-diphosphate reductase alpha chain
MDYKKILNRPARFTYQEAYNDSLKYFNGDDLAASTFVSKYALKDPGVKGDANFVETNPSYMHDRLAAEFARIDCQYNNEDVNSNYWKGQFNIYREAFHQFKKIVPQGSPMFGIGNRFVNVSLSNCVVVESPEDTISSIFDAGKDLANLFKRRCGVGIDISNLRPDGAVVNNSAGSSTGAWSFANHYSEVTRQIGQLGRRGALMVTIDTTNPDCDRFTTMKQDLTYCTGANVSLKVEDNFMKAVESDDYWVMKHPANLDHENLIENHPGEWVESPEETDQEGRVVKLKSEYYVSSTLNKKFVIRRFKAQEFWALVTECARNTAEPGIIFWDNYNANLPACEYDDFKSVCVNPCSEISLSPYDSCRLASLNLVGFVDNPYTDKSKFNMSKWKDYVKLGMRIMDNVVDLEIECLDNIVNVVDTKDEIELWNKLKTAAINGRRTGLGTHGLADCLASLGIQYDSEEGLKQINSIYKALRDAAYEASVELAEERGAFPHWDWETEKENVFLKRLPKALYERMAKSGRRNISLLTNAPTGSVSIVSQTSSGIEPVFMNFYTRRKKINANDKDTRVDFVDQNKDKWQEYPVFHHGVLRYLELHNEILEEWKELESSNPPTKWAELVQEILPEYFVTSQNIDPLMRVKLQGTIQKYVDHGLSSTINLPKTTQSEVIADIYMASWKEGLKGVTVYVDGSRSGVLVDASASNKSTRNGDVIVETEAPTRPKTLPCDIHRASVNGKYWTVFVGKLDGKPYEVFGGSSEFVEIPRRRTEGEITKRKIERDGKKKTVYDIFIGEDDDQIEIKDVANNFKDKEYAWATRQLSLSLRHGVPVNFIVEQLRRSNESQLTHFSKAIARVLAKYTHHDEEEGDSLMSENGFYCKSGNCE